MAFEHDTPRSNLLCLMRGVLGVTAVQQLIQLLHVHIIIIIIIIIYVAIPKSHNLHSTMTEKLQKCTDLK